MINLTEPLSHLPKDKIEELEAVTQRIVETGMTCMVLLYGSFARGDWKEVSGGRSGKKSDYDILVLTKDERDCHDLRNKLYKIFDNYATVVQTTIETLGFVNMHLWEGQYFFTEIKEQGIILYADSYAKLVDAEVLNAQRIKEIAQQDYKQWYGMAQTSFKHYKYEDEDLSYAAFLLQQCVENCYTAIELVFSRNNPYEHRLTILRMNAKRYVPEMDTPFPLTTQEEKDLFFHLDAAYIGGRYIDEEHYKVTQEQLSYWEQEAQRLLEMTKMKCLRKIEALALEL